MEERTPHTGLSPEEIDAIAERAAERAIARVIDKIAERAAEKALERVYANVGRSVLKKMAWMIGVVIISAFIWMAGSGTLKP